MVKVMMYGCNGYMGHVICNLIKDMENVTVAAGIDPCPGDQKDFPVFASLDECNVDVDVIIDFSAAVAVDGVLDYAAAKKIPLVECTRRRGNLQGLQDRPAVFLLEIYNVREGASDFGCKFPFYILHNVSPFI